MTDESDSLLRAVAAAPPRPHPGLDLAGTTIAQYRIREALGIGGMGIVYRAEDTRLQRTVAIKVLHGARADDEAHRERFLREARSAASITHANIVTVHEIGEHQGRIFLVMELVAGTTLAERIAGGAIRHDQARRIAIGIARGLARAHANKIIHRDLKPGNVMLDLDGEPKIVDFGIAKLGATDSVAGHPTAEGAIIGTPLYMSPEQARGAAVDERSDVFSLGVIIYEMLSGEPRRLRGLSPDVPVDLARIVQRCLFEAPEERFADASELLSALESVPSRRPSRLRWPALVASLCALAVATFVVARRSTPDRPAHTQRTPSITEWPVPKTSSREAAAAYAAGLQAIRDANFTAAERHLATATQLDPHFAAALLRIVLLGTGKSEGLRQALNAAVDARGILDARDMRLLELARAQGAKSTAAVAHSLAADLRDDAEAQFWAGVALDGAGDAGGSKSVLARALDLDPKFAAVVAVRSASAQAAGDLDEALADADQCVALSPSATSCLRRRADIHAFRGNCDAYADDTRELLLREPESDVNYENRITALAAQGAPADALRDLAHKAEALVTNATDARALAAANAARIAVYDGDFASAEVHFLELEQVIASSTDESAHFPDAYRMALYDEEGDRAKALAAADEYLRRRPAWIYDGQGVPRAYALGIQRRAKAVSDSQAIATRKDWIAEDRRLGQSDGTAIWMTYYAWPTQTVAEAHEALAALPEYEPLHIDRLGNGHGEASGHTFVLGGAFDRALPLLRETAAWCGPMIDASADPSTIGWQFVIIQSHLFLGETLEQRGDKAGACAEYARVLQRWGHAKPKSVTADSARDHARSLGCLGQ